MQNGVNFRSTIQLNNSGFSPGPINSFHFAWSIVSRVLYPQELLWTVRCIAHGIHALGRHAIMPCKTSPKHTLQAVLPALLPALRQARLLEPSHKRLAAVHPIWPSLFASAC